MGDGGGRWGIRPPVQVTEKVDLESNWKLPMLKAWVGVTGSVFMFLAASGVLAWLIPPDVALEVAFWVFVGMGIIFAVIGIIRWLDPNPSFFYGLVGTVLAFAAVWGFGSLSDTWWIGGQGILTWIQASALLSVMMGGGAGAYWFIKELIRQYELTGRELLQKELAEREMDRAELQADREWELKRAELLGTGTVREWTITATITLKDGSGGVIEQGQTKILHFDPEKVTDSKFAYWATMILRGESVGYPTWVGQRRFVRGDYDHLIEVLAVAGGVAKDGPAQNSKYFLTDEGEDLLVTWLLAYNQVEIAEGAEEDLKEGLLEDIDDDRIISGHWEVRERDSST